MVTRMKGELALDLFQDRPWAIHPAKRAEIDTVIRAHLSGDLTQVSDFMSAAKKKNDEKAEKKPYQIIRDVAVIPVYGVLSKRVSLFSSFSGGTSTELLQKHIQDARDDRDVIASVLDFESPGGSVDGTKAAADFVFSARDIKPIVSYANGQMASGALWIGTAGDAVVTYDTAEVGSLGVAITHYDYSKQNEMRGIKETQIYSGRYKRIASGERPLSVEGEEYLQSISDTYYSIFVEAIARNCGVSVAAVLADMADGRIFIGQQAVDAGLADTVGDLNTAIDMARDLADGKNISRFIIKPKAEETNTMKITTVEQLKQTYPELVTQAENNAQAEGVGSVDIEAIKGTARSEGRAEGCQTTQADILALAGVHFGEAEATQFGAIVSSGVSVDAYKAILAARPEQTPEAVAETPEAAAIAKAKADMLAALETTGAESPGFGADGEQPAGVKKTDEQLTAEYNSSAELQDEFLTADGYIAFQKADGAGLVKILNRKED